MPPAQSVDVSQTECEAPSGALDGAQDWWRQVVTKTQGDGMLHSVPGEDAEEDNGGAGDLLGGWQAGTATQVLDGRSLVGLLNARRPLWAPGGQSWIQGIF